MHNIVDRKITEYVTIKMVEDELDRYIAAANFVEHMKCLILLEWLKGQIFIIWFKELVTFSEKDKDVYKQAQSLSAYLPDLLHFSENELKGAVQQFSKTLADPAPEKREDSESHRRNPDSLSLFDAFRKVDVVEETALMPTAGCKEPQYIGRTAKPSTSPFAIGNSQYGATTTHLAGCPEDYAQAEKKVKSQPQKNPPQDVCP
ncbi:hypothetical protein BV898_18076 [Hypsibius exemplaris]|uniref:Uncharacterized protein n=1 Tax=Hypsibius exemplaris TaxID=2072580 RepID=A0A9X6NG70_HYPEX|nr:hypothetical protein BV898_18076 [Hypsibius exemplaris]